MSDLVPGRPQPLLSTELQEGVTGRILKSGKTDGTGAFDLGEATPGLYFLNLKGLGLVAVQLDPDAPAEQLDLDLSYSSCGLSYTDHSQCPQGELRIGRVRGVVIDPTGAAIAGAEVLLFDQEDNLVVSTRPDRNGEFLAANRK